MKILSGLSNGQVLQRLGSKGATVSILGTTSETGPVVAGISGPKGALKGWKAQTAGKAAQGKFSARLTGIPAGGPYSLELRVGKSVVRVKSFFVGDVWILAGQSNMQGCGLISGAAKPHASIRAFSMRREWRAATEPLHVLVESPDLSHTEIQCSPEEGELLRRRAITGTGAGLFFARDMFTRTGVPQGLICTAHGGTSMQQWNPALKKDGGASLYGSMLLSARATGQPVAGILWYQGESDAGPVDAPLYTDRMKKLVAASRKDLGQSGLPWVIVQISRVYGKSKREEVLAWNSIQEQQRLLPARIRGLEVVAAIDLPLDDPIHIGGEGFPLLAARLASATDRLACGNRKERPMPGLQSLEGPQMQAESQSLVLSVHFNDVPGGLQSSGLPAGFTLLAADGTDTRLIFKTTLHRDTARLHLKAPLPDGLFLSYGNDVNPVCNITDGRGIPIPVFGPLRIGKAGAFLPFILQWRKSGVVPATVPLEKIGTPEIPDDAEVKDFSGESLNGFVNDHADWIGKSGLAFYTARAELPEPMRLEVLSGYDGPFRLWIDRKPFFDALRGTNPCLPDEGRKAVSLKAGTHEFHVAMDINSGMAWGFFLRFRRLDVPERKIESGDFAKPLYSA